MTGLRRGKPLDPGLQAERTAMAWQRTALGVGGIGALLLHHAGGIGVRAVPGAVGLAVALVLVLAGEQRYERTVRHVRAGNPLAGRFLVRLLATATVLLSVCAVVLVAVGGG
ncbi:MAG TPA: DUF202 domain-containing protein [Marmoricola sp.]|nr:DUF202 domain-containing protein [Marmoricola sp.]